MEKFQIYRKLMQKELRNYQKKLFYYLSNNIKKIHCDSFEIKPVHGIKSANGNDRTDYMWIKLIVDFDKEYWLTLFFNEIDVTTGNMHTQIGRIQFWKNIKNKTPNNFILDNNKKRWYLNLENCDQPKNGIAIINDNEEVIINEFIKFVNCDIDLKKRKN